MCELQSNCRFSRDELSKVKCTTAQKRVQISHEESKKRQKKRERKKKKTGKIVSSIWMMCNWNECNVPKIVPFAVNSNSTFTSISTRTGISSKYKKKYKFEKKNSNKMHLVYWDASMKWMWSEWERVRRLIKKSTDFRHQSKSSRNNWVQILCAFKFKALQYRHMHTKSVRKHEAF